MKQKFTLLDVISSLVEIRERCVGLRVGNFYDIDKKTYLIRFGGAENRTTLMIDLGCKIYMTNYVWTKNMFPSSFTMKCRKTIGNKRLTSIKQLGIDRVVDLEFGSGPKSYHLILELYDKGNIVLTDFEYNMLQFCRPPKQVENNTMNSNIYNFNHIRQNSILIEKTKFYEMLANISEKSNLKKILSHNFANYGTVLIEHCLLEFGFSSKSCFGTDALIDRDLDRLYQVIEKADSILTKFINGEIKGGYITRDVKKAGSEDIYINTAYHPFLFNQHREQNIKKFDLFSEAIDEFYSSIEQQKTQVQLISREKTAQAKVENVRKDHETRLKTLEKEQDTNLEAAELIQENQEIIDKVILMINTSLANQISWPEIGNFIMEAKKEGHSLASIIEYTKFESNSVALTLKNDSVSKSILIDLSLSAFSNSKLYFDRRRFVIDKINRTGASQNKALSSANSKMKQVLKENKVQIKVKLHRKPNWFERYRWFISSENYLVLAGRDAQENEFLVKRHTNKNDIFVHAELHGSASVIIKVPREHVRENSQMPVPIKTLCEAGCFAISFSSAWESHVTIPAYWVHMNQVSKTAPTGEYLSVGGFSIKGTKNYLPLPTLILGIGILFKIDQTSLENHINDRTPKWGDDKYYLQSLKETHPTSEEPAIEEISISSNPSDTESSSEFDQDLNHDSKYLAEVIKEKKSCDEIERSMESTEYAIHVETPTHPENVNSNKQENNISQFKRGQKSKYKHKKLKYKDQDDDDRELADKLLHVSLKPKTSKKQRKIQKEFEKQTKMLTKSIINSKRKKDIEEPEDFIINSDESGTEKTEEERNILSTFVGNPLFQDQLLYAILVCAPYSTLSTYKYKVKLTPGTTKRGKALKTALGMFLSAKESIEQERLLINVLKEVDNSRYIPTMVKLSAPNMFINKRKQN